MTLQKVARLAGVSVSTASKALTNSKDVSDETKRLVLSVAETLGYFSENKRRKLENRKTDNPTVGIICPEIISVYYSEIVTSLCRKITETGGKASVFISEFDNNRQSDILRRCVAESTIDGVLSLDSEESVLLPSSLPTVYLTRTEKCDCVYNDYESGLSDIVSYLTDMGHRSVAFAGEPLTRAKEAYFLQALEAQCLDCPAEFVFCEKGRFELSGKRAAEKLLENPVRPTAVICAYDEIAYGLISTLRRAGVRVPENISVIGINDIPTSKYLDTPLTTLRHDVERLCDEALRLLLDRLKDPKAQRAPISIAIPCALVERSSVLKIKT